MSPVFLLPLRQQTKIYQSTKTELESLALNVINSSDRLVTQLGNDTVKNSLNLMLLEIPPCNNEHWCGSTNSLFCNKNAQTNRYTYPRNV